MDERLTQLRQILQSYYDQDELRTLCFDLGVEYDGLPGQGTFAKARELLRFLQRHDRLTDLVNLGRQQRPNAPWVDIPPALAAAPLPDDPPPAGESISAVISGATIGGQVAVGKNIQQTHSVGAADWSADAEPLPQVLARLKAQVQATAPPGTQAAALGRLAELQAALDEPALSALELATMEAVKLWFARHLPALAGALAQVILHPAVRQRVWAAGSELAAEFERRF